MYRVVYETEQAPYKHWFLLLLIKSTLLMTVMEQVLLVFHLNGVVIHRESGK